MPSFSFGKNLVLRKWFVRADQNLFLGVGAVLASTTQLKMLFTGVSNASAPENLISCGDSFLAEGDG